MYEHFFIYNHKSMKNTLYTQWPILSKVFFFNNNNNNNKIFDSFCAIYKHFHICLYTYIIYT